MDIIRARRALLHKWVEGDSLYESSVIAQWDEQLRPYEVHDQKLVVLQWLREAARIVVDLV
ncbi:MAG: hypothetical protein FalmKO_32170 [Falsiruegeria mediterranea]